jgi:hypothetical protein
MKKALDAFPAVLLLAFFIYIAINPVSLGPIVGFVASSLLFAYQQYLFRTEQPDLAQELKKIHAELYNKIEASKQDASKELIDLKTELAKFSLTMTRVPGVMDRPKDKTKIQF